ncbi:MAG: PAS domain-containing protein, partial [Ktedonobacterales bacterium]
MATRRTSSRLPRIPERAERSAPTRRAAGVAVAAPGDDESAAPASLHERLVEASPYAVLALDAATLRITLANRAARQLLAGVAGMAGVAGWSGEALPGRTLVAALPWAAERGMLAYLELAVRTGE